MEAGLTPMDKWRRIYGAGRGVMEPACGHGAALVTWESGIVDIVVKYARCHDLRPYELIVNSIIATLEVYHRVSLKRQVFWFLM